MTPRDLIAVIRDRQTPGQQDFMNFAKGLSDGSVSDAQAGAFAMAVLLNGITPQGRVDLTLAMRDSGDVLTWNLDGPVLDKHSTGGVGDCVSLILAPALACCGVYVPMISGRGLGHTGGTLDKLEAIPGVKTQIEEHRFQQITRELGFCIAGATGQIAPADKRLYAVRDITASVESIDLITASILSKKLAAGLDGLVLDVKVGSGAFMKSVDEARALARSLVQTANGAGCPTSALITDMNQPLAPSLGNAIEVAACMRVLAGKVTHAPRLYELSVRLGVELLTSAGITKAEAQDKLTAAFSSGAAMEMFARLVAELGGPTDFSEKWQSVLPVAPVRKEVQAQQAGFVANIDGETLGMAVVHLGGGRLVETDQIDPMVGLTDVACLGDRVEIGQPIAVVHAQSESDVDHAVQRVQQAIQITENPPQISDLIHEWVV